MVCYYDFRYVGKSKVMFEPGDTGTIVVRMNWFTGRFTVRLVHGFALKEYPISTIVYKDFASLEADFRLSEPYSKRQFFKREG